MAKVLALIAMVLLAGFSGGTSFAVAKQSAHLAVMPTVQVTISTFADGGGQSQQYVSPSQSGDAFSTPGTDCCSDPTCFNANHCHHGGLSALTTAPTHGLSPRHTGGYQLGPHRIPVQNVPHSISKPPRA